MTEAGSSPGARFAIDRLEVDEAGARYRVTIGEGEDACRADVRLGRGPLVLPDFDRPPPAWTIETLKGLLRTLAKNHADAADWPRRVHRWRAPRG